MERVREIDVRSRVIMIISVVICIIVCLSRLLIITVITPLPQGAQRDKNARELKLANGAINDDGCVSVMLLRSM